MTTRSRRKVLDVDQLHIERERLNLALADFVFAPFCSNILGGRERRRRLLCGRSDLLGVLIERRFVGGFAKHFTDIQRGSCGHHLLPRRKVSRPRA